MKSLKYLFLLTALITLGLSSCTKDDVIVDETEIPTVNPEEGTNNPLINNIESRSEEGCELACFTIDYPFAFDIDGEIVEVTADTDFEAIFENIGEDSFIDFVYPLNVTYEDGTTGVINNGEELGEAFASCVPDDGWGVTDSTFNGENLFPAFLIDTDGYCFDLVYPLDLVNIEETSVTINNEDEFIEALAATDYILFFEFPLDVMTEDGATITLEDGDSLFELLLSCDQTGGGFDTTFGFGGEIGCYGVEFPFTVIMGDGSTVEVNNHDEFCALMIEGNMVGFSFPLTLIAEDGTLIVVNSQDELDEALEDCWDIPPFGNDGNLLLLLSGSIDGEGECYDINWPIIISVDSVEISVASLEEVFENVIGSDIFIPEVIFPVSVTLIESGDVVELNSTEDIIELLEECE